MIRKKKLIEHINFLENELNKKEKELKEKEEELKWAAESKKRVIEECIHFRDVFIEADKYINNLYPNRISHNKDKNITVVWFNDEKVVVKLAPGETGDVYSAVAYAITKHMYKNNTQFKKHVDRRTIKHEK